MDTKTNEKAGPGGGQVDAVVVPQILMGFCEPDSPMETPFAVDGWTIFANRNIAVRVPAIQGIDRESPFDSVKTFPWVPTMDGEWCDIPEFTIPHGRQCDVCNGTGFVMFCPECNGVGTLEFETKYNIYEVDCRYCHGDGTVTGAASRCERCAGTGLIKTSIFEVEFMGRTVNGYVLDRLRVLPGVKVFSKQSDGAFNHFRFDGGHGLFIGLRL